MRILRELRAGLSIVISNYIKKVRAGQGENEKEAAESSRPQRQDAVFEVLRGAMGIASLRMTQFIFGCFGEDGGLRND